VTSARALTAADLGLDGTDAIVQGTMRVKGGRALVKVDYLGSEKGLGTAGLKAFGRLKEAAKAEGATSLRIETSPIIESSGRLRTILGKQGFQSRPNGTMFYEGGL
jgi:hypothetical protein